ncbi:hypothetical protein KPL71_012393 [Citrus sinensis]|uniref:Uncharacterized protein n=1 Tax=Citrus sinensis TaxID=2711 RepID=A0ACB8LAI8_CITSI|nr:hypothetical protein KPL71_012393 [Citrus sinensis]
MGTNKERLDRMEMELQEMRQVMQRSVTETGETRVLINGMEGRLKEVLDALSGLRLTQEKPQLNQGELASSSLQGMATREEGTHPHNRFFKMDFPRFSGDDPTEWLSRVEQYFEFQDTTEERRVSLASFHLEGEANQWWQWLKRVYQDEGIIITWRMFKREIIARFGPTGYECFDEALSRVKQTGTLRDYQREFEKLATRVIGWPQSALIGTFLGGLKEEIADEVRMARPQSLRDAIGIARMKDDQLTRRRRQGKLEFGRTGLQRVVTLNTTPPLHTLASKPTGGAPVKRLTWEEMQHRREKGLCFNYNERFTPGHKCNRPQLFVIEGGVSGEDESEASATTMEQEGNEGNEGHYFNITMHAFSGWKGPRTLQLRAYIDKHPVTVLVDSGSSHNFINDRVARYLRLPVTSTEKFNVKVADGGQITCQDKHEGVCMNIQGVPITVTLFSLPLQGLDVVLGVQWLRELGPILCDWNELTMQFNWQGESKVICGLKDPDTTAVSLRSLEKKLSGGGFLFAVVVGEATDNNKKHEEIPHDFKGVISEFAPLFDEPRSLPPVRDIDHKIPLKEGISAVNVRPYRYAHFQKNEIEKQVDEMLRNGTIRPSHSSFSSPVLLVKKKDGSWRFCTDYRALNEVTIKDRFPIPTVDDMIDELHGAKYFTKLDFRAGYHQIRVHPEDIHKTAFRTHNGHYEYLVMPFGLCNAPSTFQATMNSIFKPILRKFVLVFFDDILIYSCSWEMHLEHVRVVLQILQNQQFFFKRSKCSFGQTKIEYLGHFISKKGVQVDDKKIAAMRNWPRPRNVTELRGFLGLTGYYRKFVKNYGTIAAPLTQLLKKGQFNWGENAEEAFEALKTAMTTTPVLAIPNFNEIFVIETDASDAGIGAVLSQQGRPIAFLSRALGPQKRAWPIYSKEMLAIIEAVRCWRPYLMGRKFQILTDQRSLKYFLEQRVTTPEQQKWVTKLLGYEYDIKYRPGKENSAADSLSREGGGSIIHAISRPEFVIWEELKKESRESPWVQQILSQREVDSKKSYEYVWKDGLLYYKGSIVIPPESSLKTRLLQEFHDTKIGGHSGVLRTWKRLAQNFYWDGMKNDVKKYVAACDTCQRNKSESRSPAGLLQPLPVPSQVWEDISLDFIEGLPNSNGKNAILVVVDRLTKYAHFIGVSHPFTAKKIAEVFVDRVARLHGVPCTIVSDRDVVFTSNFWKEFFKLQGTQLKMSSAYHPETDGQTEVVNRSLQQYLRCMVSQHPKQWSSHLPWAEFWYNTTYHSAIGLTPFQALYGRPPPSVSRYIPGSSNVHEVDKELMSRDDLLKLLKQNLEMAKNRMKQQADRHRRDVQFDIGDLVYLKLQPFRQQSVFKRANQKLASKYYGPFPIIEKIGVSAYKLQLPEGTKIHPVFHVSCLKKRIGDGEVPLYTTPPVSDDGILELQPATVKDFRWVKRTGKLHMEVLVHWSHLPEEEATWESVDQVKQQFPDFDLEGKVNVPGGGYVEPRKTTRARKPNPKYLTFLDVSNTNDVGAKRLGQVLDA